MPFEVNNSTKTIEIASKLKVSLYKAAEKRAKKSFFIRFSGIGVSGASSLISVVLRIGALGEKIVKGLSNIFGALISKKCHFKTGCKQLFLGTPLAFLDVLYLPFYTGGGGLITSAALFFKPEKYAHSRKVMHRKIAYMAGKPD